MVKLRPYQQDLLRQVQDALDANFKARVMMQLPTGGGKTIIAGALLADWLTGGRKAQLPTGGGKTIIAGALLAIGSRAGARRFG